MKAYHLVKLNKLILFFIIITVASCGDNIVREKDKYPEIPNFPKFKDRVFQSKKVSELKLTLDKHFKNQNQNDYFFKYLVSDSTLFIVTYYSDKEFPATPLSNEDYIVDLLVINQKQTTHSRWIDNDFEINFNLDKLKNMIIGKRKYNAKTNYSDYELINDLDNSERVDTVFKSWLPESVLNYDVNYFKEFDRATVDSKGRVTGGGNNGYGYQHNPVYITYYKLDYKNKKGITKIDYREKKLPLFIKANKDLYCITYNNDFIDIDNRIKKYLIYRIE